MLYALEQFPDVTKCTEYLKDRCTQMGPIMSPEKMGDHVDVVVHKYYDGLDASLVDIWAAMIGKVLEPRLEKKERTRLSDTQDRVQTCELPFPIYTAVFVKEETPTEAYAGEDTFV